MGYFKEIHEFKNYFKGIRVLARNLKMPVSKFLAVQI